MATVEQVLMIGDTMETTSRGAFEAEYASWCSEARPNSRGLVITCINRDALLQNVDRPPL